MKRSVLRRWLGAGAVLLATAAPLGIAQAAVPGTLTHQGRLYKDSGDPVTDTLEITFAIYDTPGAAEPLWTETHTVSFEDGYFSVSLGADKPLGKAVFTGAERYLGITIGEDA